MNAPLPEHIRKALETVTLDDKYSLDYGRAFMSGVQALVKLPMLQRLRDAQQGKNTAGFISGYRGSPLGGYDQALWKASKFLKEQNAKTYRLRINTLAADHRTAAHQPTGPVEGDPDDERTPARTHPQGVGNRHAG